MKHKVKSNDVNTRLDVFVAQLSGASRSKLAHTFAANEVFVNGVAMKPSYRLKLDDVVTFTVVVPTLPSLLPYNYNLDVLYEDAAIIVVNKAAGLVVHPAYGHNSDTLVNALLYRNTTLSEGSSELRPGIVHRLDKDTSGVLVVAKTNDAHAHLAAQFKAQTVKRVYTALVKGHVSEEAGLIRTYLTRSAQNYQKMVASATTGKLAVTHFRVLERFHNYLLFNLELETGRTHQIRAHLEFIGCSIEGDTLYGTNNRQLYKKGQLLHATSLGFIHPTSKKAVSFTAPLPPHFAAILKQLRKDQ